MVYLSHIIANLPIIILGITAFFGLRVISIVKNPLPIKMLAQLWLLYFIVEAVSIFLRDYFAMDNKWLYNIFFAFFFLYLSGIFFHVLKSQPIQILIQIFYGAFLVFVIINTMFIQGLNTFQTITYVVGGVFVIFLSGAYFWQLLISSENDKLAHDSFFWLSFALIVYFGAKVPFYGMFNYLERNFYDFTVFYHTYISNSFTIFLNVLVSIAFTCRKNYPK